jgi:enoyl-CoA hydratase/carnithine racemase
MMQPKHFQWRVEGKVGVITLNRPERKNPLTFESYAELRDHLRALQYEKGVRVVCGATGSFARPSI